MTLLVTGAAGFIGSNLVHHLRRIWPERNVVSFDLLSYAGNLENLAALRDDAFRDGEWRLAGHTLVITLEPCRMCAGAAVLARVDRVVFGAFDPKAGAVGSLWDVVRDRRLNHRPEVVTGVLR